MSFVGFAWLLGVLGPLGMNGRGSGAMHGGGVCIFGGLLYTICEQGRTLMVSVCFCPLWYADLWIRLFVSEQFVVVPDSLAHST